MRTCEPRLLESPLGWLAVSPADYPYRIGVVADDPAEARRRFAAALEAWAELHERASDPAAVATAPSVGDS